MRHFEIIQDTQRIFSIVEALFESDADAPVFYSRGMLQTWTKVTGKTFELAVLQKDNLPAIALPIVRNKLTENVTYPGWDNLNVLCARNCSDEIKQEFWQKLLLVRKRMVLSCFTQNHEDFKHLSNALTIEVPMRKCPYIDISGGWEQLNENLGKKLVRNIRQYGNKAEAAEITITVKRGKEIPFSKKKEGLQTSYSFHNQRMADINQQSKFTPETQNLYHETVLATAENVFIIEAHNAENERIAWYYGLSNRNRLAWFNGGYHPEYQQYSIGTLLVSRLIDFALANNMRIFDFLRGNESYKQKWTQQFDLNETIYLAHTGLRNAFAINKRFFNDTRKRMGSKRALRELIKVVKD